MTMQSFSVSPRIPRYLRVEQRKIEEIGAAYGLDFFPIIFEMVTYDQMNEIAAYGGFPNRYPHWRFGMEYERLAKSTGRKSSPYSAAIFSIFRCSTRRYRGMRGEVE